MARPMRVYEWDVTMLARGVEVTLRVWGTSKTDAKRAAKEWEPDGHTLHVEQVPGSGRLV